jgi:hypothetical protein
MKRLPLFQSLGILLVLVLTLAAAAPARGTSAGSAASLLPGVQDPQPATTTCTASTRCYSDFSLISCSGTSCFKRVGCSVTCDGVETECPGGDEPYCP